MTNTPGKAVGVNAAAEAKTALREEMARRLADCRLRWNSSLLLARKRHGRDGLVLLESLLAETLAVMEGLKTGRLVPLDSDLGERVESMRGALNQRSVDALDKALVQAEAIRLAERRSGKERRALSRMHHAAGQLLRQAERNFAQARRGALADPKDKGKRTSRITGLIVFAALLGLVALVLWGPLGNLLGSSSLDLVHDLDTPYARADNLSEPEHSRVVTWRWGLGPETRIVFGLDGEQEVRAELRFVSYIYQDVDIEVNGEHAATMDHVFPEGIFNQVLEFTGRDGENEIVVRYGDWNHKAEQAPQAQDPRALAVAFVKLAIEADALQTVR